ncbi:MAG: sigma-54-dependent Fis family transcriptional regulator [Bryobacterales bacterium]|nr:sigma-54-dependent Fis family transcriptional regulator [Bryobacterales bacterium]
MYRNSALATARKSPEVEMIGISPAIQELRRKIDRIASNQNPVLILGETGTGKEIVARRIHERSGLKKFVPIDCSVLVGPLMESELFGYIKGAFTGAEATRTGLLEESHLGTAFLDEIGELPLALQVKLLRVLQEREFRPLGSTVSKYVECRVLAATNRNLAEEVQRGRFRQDLFYRLNVITLRIPPLRERRQDIPLLAKHFLDRCGPGLQFTPEVEEVFRSYDWPGNVRELENCIQRMVAVSAAPRLRLADLPSPLMNSMRNQGRTSTANASAPGSPAASSSVGPAANTLPREVAQHWGVNPDFNPCQILPLSELERRAIVAALHATRGDRTMAAQLLGIGRTTLYRKLKSYGIEA